MIGCSFKFKVQGIGFLFATCLWNCQKIPPKGANHSHAKAIWFPCEQFEGGDSAGGEADALCRTAAHTTTGEAVGPKAARPVDRALQSDEVSLAVSSQGRSCDDNQFIVGFVQSRQQIEKLGFVVEERRISHIICRDIAPSVIAGKQLQREYLTADDYRSETMGSTSIGLIKAVGVESNEAGVEQHLARLYKADQQLLDNFRKSIILGPGEHDSRGEPGYFAGTGSPKSLICGSDEAVADVHLAMAADIQGILLVPDFFLSGFSCQKYELGP